MTPRTTSPRERLDREKILIGALAIADSEGLAAVTLRRIAQEHGVTPMALYRHFRDKDELLNGIADHLLDSVDLPAPSDEPWDVQLRGLFAALLAVLHPHPQVATLAIPRVLASEGGLELAERALGLLADAGFDEGRAAALGSQTLCATVALIAYEPGIGIHADDEEREAVLREKRARLAMLSPRRYPRVTAAADALTGCVTQPEPFLDVALDLLIAGVRGLAPVPAATR